MNRISFVWKKIINMYFWEEKKPNDSQSGFLIFFFPFDTIDIWPEIFQVTKNEWIQNNNNKNLIKISFSSFVRSCVFPIDSIITHHTHHQLIFFFSLFFGLKINIKKVDNFHRLYFKKKTEKIWMIPADFISSYFHWSNNQIWCLTNESKWCWMNVETCDAYLNFQSRSQSQSSSHLDLGEKKWFQKRKRNKITTKKKTKQMNWVDDWLMMMMMKNGKNHEKIFIINNRRFDKVIFWFSFSFFLLAGQYHYLRLYFERIHWTAKRCQIAASIVFLALVKKMMMMLNRDRKTSWHFSTTTTSKIDTSSIVWIYWNFNDWIAWISFWIFFLFFPSKKIKNRKYLETTNQQLFNRYL